MVGKVVSHKSGNCFRHRRFWSMFLFISIFDPQPSEREPQKRVPWIPCESGDRKSGLCQAGAPCPS